MKKITYNEALGDMMNQPPINNCTLTTEEIETAITSISNKLKGPLSNVERLLLVGDRSKLRATLKSRIAEEKIMNLEKEYVEKALNSVEPHLHLLPSEVARNIRLAISVMKTYGATPAELSSEIGSEKWAICRNTEANRERYGKCITAKQYEAAERRAIESREPNWKYI